MPSFIELFAYQEERFETEIIDSFLKHLSGSVKAESAGWSEKENALSEDDVEDPRDLDGYRSYIDDQQYYLGEVEKLGHELSILALYKQVEITSKGILHRYFPDVPSGQLYKIDELKKSLPFDMTALINYSARDELREINNCIKHSGIIDSRLSRYPGWVDGEELENVGEAYSRLKPLVQNFMRAFAAESRKHRKVDPPSGMPVEE